MHENRLLLALVLQIQHCSLVASMRHLAAAAALHAAAALRPLDRRATLQGFAVGTTTALIPLPPASAAAAAAAALKTVSWSATDGFDSDFPSQINFIEFDEKAYKAMRDDPRRTPKFAKAIRSRLAELKDAVVLDLGTGPFCVLALIAATAGAKKVYAVDVGKGQLDWSLREHEQVTVLESTNARYLTDKQVPDLVDLITCDVSFIGLEKVLPAAIARGTKRAHLIALIKPQFQAGREHVGKGGVVHDPEIHRAVCADVEKWIEQSMCWRVLGISESPIIGPKGNKEFLKALKVFL